jgi:biopolymer transport protein ExbB/TolQ
MNVQDHSLLELFWLGGPIMWVLLGLSTIGLVLFVERALFLHRGQIRTTQFLEGIKNIVRKRRVVEALTVAEETPGPVAAMVKAGLLHYDEAEERIRGAMTEAALVEIPVLERRLGAIAVIAQTAPVLGLLGTILGMIEAYQQFEKGGAFRHGGIAFGWHVAGAALHGCRPGGGRRRQARPSLPRGTHAGVWSTIWSGWPTTYCGFSSSDRGAGTADGAAAEAAPVVEKP